jgi:hypothetical protein
MCLNKNLPATFLVVLSLVGFVGLLTPFNALAQAAPTQIFFGAGPSFNGSGDAVGLMVTNEVQVPVARRFFISPGFQYTRHSGAIDLGMSEYRYITAGVSLHANINYALLETAKHRIALGVGPYVRHQTDTYTGLSATTIGGQPYLQLDYRDKMNTVSVGYHIAISYYTVLSRRLVGGIRVGLQNDTNGDIITSSNLMIGVKL